MRVGIVLQARMGSSRLPGKVLAPLAGRPMLWHILDRLRRARRADALIVATTPADADGPLGDLARQEGVALFAGSEEDLLDRITRAARAFALDHVVRCTGDNPLVDHPSLDRLIDLHLASGADLTHSKTDRGNRLPVGAGAEAYTLAALEASLTESRLPHHREHVDEYIHEHPDRFRIVNLPVPPEQDCPQLHLTVDSPEDYGRLAALYRALHVPGEAIDLGRVIRWCVQRGWVDGPGPLRIVFQTRGDHATGMGHVMRSLALARAFEPPEVAEAIRFVVPAEGEASRMIRARGYPAEAGAGAGAAPADVAVVDELNPSATVFAAWRAAGALTVSIDDPGPARYAADLAFSMLYAPEAARPAGACAEEFGGFAYVALRPEFAGLPPKPIRPQGHRILVAQGGSDTYGVIPRLCRVIARLEPGLAVDVILGPAFQHEAPLREAIGGDPRFRCHRDLPSPLPLMAEADVAISAAGLTAMELAAAGTPMLLLVTEPKEAETAAALARAGAAVYLGESGRVDDGALAAALGSLLDDASRRSVLSRAARALVDGRGAHRVVEAILARLGRRRPPGSPGALQHAGTAAHGRG